MDGSVPVPLTPEMIVKGFDVPCLSIIPQINSENDDLWGCSDDILNNNNNAVFSSFQKLKKVKANLENLYKGEFVSNLLHQATDRKDRYSKRTHHSLKVGDLVGIKDDFLKPFNYPLGLVVKIESNDLQEVISAHIRKANGEVVRRHVDNLIFLTETSAKFEDKVPEEPDIAYTPPSFDNKIRRQAAQACQDRNRSIFQQELGVGQSMVRLDQDCMSATQTCQVCMSLLDKWESQRA